MWIFNQKTTFNLNGKDELHSLSDYSIESESVMCVVMTDNAFNWELKGMLNV